MSVWLSFFYPLYLLFLGSEACLSQEFVVGITHFPPKYMYTFLTLLVTLSHLRRSVICVSSPKRLISSPGVALLSDLKKIVPLPAWYLILFNGKCVFLHELCIHFYCFVPGVNFGNWYFEVKVNDMQNEAAARVGWSLALGKQFWTSQ